VHVYLGVVDRDCVISSQVRKVQKFNLAGTDMGEDTKSVCMDRNDHNACRQ